MQGNLIIKNASELVTCSGFTAKNGKEMSELGIIADGAVVIEQGKISRVGGTADVMADLKTSGRDLSGFETIDASGKAVLPGFVDSHTHLVFSGYRADEYAWRLKGDSYMDILQRGGGILSTVRATRSATREELVAVRVEAAGFHAGLRGHHRRGEERLRPGPRNRGHASSRSWPT